MAIAARNFAESGSYIGILPACMGPKDTGCSAWGDMIVGMRTPTRKAATGSVGTVDTQFLDLPNPLALDCGRVLHPV